MGRKKIDKTKKNKIISISVLPQQALFIYNHKNFDTSKYFQIALQQIIDLYEEFEDTIKQGRIIL